MSNLEYKIFMSEEGDWFIAAKKLGKRVKVLSEGHYEEEAYRSILEDLGYDVPVIEKNMMEEGTYKPTLKDFKEE